MLALYRGLTSALLPLLPLWQWRRMRQGKEDPARWKERYGITDAARPEGRVVWFHAASIGESVALLPLIGRMLDARADLSAVVTTGTRSSAALLAERLPPRARHQYVPYDTAFGARRFLRHWRPDLAVWTESELWPVLIAEAAAQAPLLLVNARISARSAVGWRRFPRSIRRLLSRFALILARSDEDAARFAALAGSPVRCLGDLKYAAPPLPVDPEALSALQATLGDRPRWLAASTHPGEEAEVMAAHRRLREAHPRLLTILVPRHAHRGERIVAEWRAQGLAVARRAAGETVTAETECYLADTTGELGLFYRMSGIAFLGGSLVPHGGQNPLEAARLGNAILHGPHVANFAAIFAELEGAGGAQAVADAASLAATAGALLADAPRRIAMAAAARRVGEQGADVLEDVYAAIIPFLPAPVS